MPCGGHREVAAAGSGVGNWEQHAGPWHRVAAFRVAAGDTGAGDMEVFLFFFTLHPLQRPWPEKDADIL